MCPKTFLKTGHLEGLIPFLHVPRHIKLLININVSEHISMADRVSACSPYIPSNQISPRVLLSRPIVNRSSLDACKVYHEAVLVINCVTTGEKVNPRRYRRVGSLLR